MRRGLSTVGWGIEGCGAGWHAGGLQHLPELNNNPNIHKKQ